MTTSKKILSRAQINQILNKTTKYYSNKINEHGVSARGVDWNSIESQYLRFDKLLQVCETSSFSVIDYGCGYGALIDYLIQLKYSFQYVGFDIAEPMLLQAKKLHSSKSNCQFISQSEKLEPADYVVASGIFNVKQDTEDKKWISYMMETLDEMDALAIKGFSFNVLTLYSDPMRRRSDLFYADPFFWFDYCKRKYSRFVSLLHDYHLYEFTILVRK